ncbi:fibrous sheath-interacting protein 1 isoform X3 [Notolabrus celidotus]|uniref:fibrous sheath-interacting protein 1 isoform X3 n=1 Tax=Notolabrus celidotus TaxID=1203425 RepID=UPI00148FF26E|nr:fibrous sheath-interacting protein 1 isoform X3 [Notolabrus celidotus]
MEIIRGSLEDISRPASSEQTGSRVSSMSLPHNERISPTTSFSLVVLSKDATNIKIRSNTEDAMVNSTARGLPDKGQLRANLTDEEKEDSKLQRAIEEMRRLDEMLAEKICRENEVRRQRKELQARLWQELMQSKPEGHSECASEASNTRLFLALEAPPNTEEEENFVPLFETQVPDCDHTGDGKYMEQYEKMSDSWIESFEVGHEERGEEQFEGSHCGASKGKKKQKDFVKRNIEHVSGEGAQVRLTQAEKERLAELLQGADEKEDDNARGADSEEDMWAVSLSTGQGYTPEPSDLEHLHNIDSKIRCFLPAEDFFSVQSSYIDIGRMSQGQGSQVGWTCDGDRQPGEKVLQDIKERRGQERRLQEIQQQLELLGMGQEMTVKVKSIAKGQILLHACQRTTTCSAAGCVHAGMCPCCLWSSYPEIESPGLAEEQLLSLLDECELAESWIQDLEMQRDPKEDHI